MANLQENNRAKVQLLRELEVQQGWKLYQDHLRQLCKQSNKVKQEALRASDFNTALYRQGKEDGINLVVSELHNYITELNLPKLEDKQGAY